MKVEEIIAVGVVLPILLSIVLGFAFFARKTKTAQGNMVKRNIALIKETLGSSVEYMDKGKLPYHIVGEDPSLHANYANSCLCRHMLTGNYKGTNYVVTNMETTHSKGYGEISHSIFSGSYIFLNVRLDDVKPLYACHNDFWKDFNVKGNLHFKTRSKEIYEGNFMNFKLLLAKEHWNKNEITSNVRAMLQALFLQSDHSISLFVYSDGKLGLAIRNYKFFNFHKGKLPELNDNASESTFIRAMVQKDAKVIKDYLERLQPLLKQ